MEGAGKTTQLRLVEEALRERGYEPVVTREPGGTEVGESIRKVLLDGPDSIGPITELFLILAARAAFVDRVVRPALAAARIVLTDRYDLSTLAYQGGGRNLDLQRLHSINDLATGGLRPDLYLVLDVDIDEGVRRRGVTRGDRIESQGDAFHRRVAEVYRKLAEERPDVALVDGRGEIEEVFRSVWEVLGAYFPETFAPDAG